jgi:hypothetical protein
MSEPGVGHWITPAGRRPAGTQAKPYLALNVGFMKEELTGMYDADLRDQGLGAGAPRSGRAGVRHRAGL